MFIDNLFEEFGAKLSDAVDAITSLRENAEAIRERMETIIDSCETIESEL